jgi:hypothetical protein
MSHLEHEYVVMSMLLFHLFHPPTHPSKVQKEFFLSHPKPSPHQ